MPRRLSHDAPVPLADGLEEEDGGGDGDVERVEAAEHRDADVRIRGAAPGVGEAGGFRAHDKGGRTGHFRIVIPLGILQLGRQDADAACLEPGDDLLAGGGCDLAGEDAPEAGADEVGIVEVREGIAEDDGVGPGGVRAAEHGA